MDLEQYATREGREWVIYVANEEEYHRCIAEYRKTHRFILDSYDRYEVGYSNTKRQYLYPRKSQWSSEIDESEQYRYITFKEILNQGVIYELW